MRKIRKGDNVIVISGRDKGRKGAVVSVLDDDTVIVENVNRVKRHTRANPQMNKTGGIIEKEMPMHVSKVALFNPATQKADRVGVKRLADGKRVRFSKSTDVLLAASAPIYGLPAWQGCNSITARRSWPSSARISASPTRWKCPRS
jgi:large subunit ribosomal protein L24